MGTLNIPASSLIYLDTSPVIYSVEKFPEYLPLLYHRIPGQFSRDLPRYADFLVNSSQP
jgi:hypothetical protein